MPRLPVVSGDDCIRALGKIGYSIARIKGDHVRLRCPGRKPVTVPLHKELDPGTLKSILREAEVTVDEFVRLR